MLVSSRVSVVLPAVCALSLSPPRLAAQPLFTNATSAAAIDFVHTAPQDLDFGTGAAWLDFDRDGYLDLYVTRRIGANRLYRNIGDGQFTEIASAVGAADVLHDGAGVAVADFNNDGWRDLYLANADDDVLLKNLDGRAFIDVTESAGITGVGRGQSASWGDYDRDGFLDVYVANHRSKEPSAAGDRDYLFRNNGDETFTDVSHLLGAENLSGYGFIGAWSDYDGDGDVDIFLVNDCPFGPLPIRLFRNDGGTDALHWRFVEVSDLLGIGHCAAGMGIAIGDVDRDGSLDYFHTSFGRPYLLRNRYGRFDDVTVASGIFQRSKYTESGALRLTWGANLFDYDLDGWLDLYVCSGSMDAEQEPQENLFFHNRGGGFRFTDVTDGSGAANALRSRTSVTGDYDGDGDLDLFVVDYGGPGTLCRNENQNNNHYLSVELVGTVSNRDGIGARVRLESAGGVQTAEVHSGTSLGGGDDVAPHFGLGPDDVVHWLRIRWPSGIEQTLRDVAVDRRMRVVEPAAPAVVAPTATHLYQNHPNPFNPSTHIRYDTAVRWVELAIYNARGVRVRRVERTHRGPGSYEFVWDGTDDRGSPVPTGVYFYRLTAGGDSQTRKLVILR